MPHARLGLCVLSLSVLLCAIPHRADAWQASQGIRDQSRLVTKTICAWQLPPCATAGTCEAYGFVAALPGNAVRVDVRIGHKRRTGPVHVGIWQVWGFVQDGTGASYSTPVWFEWPQQVWHGPCVAVNMTFGKGQVFISLRDVDEAINDSWPSVEIFQTTLAIAGLPIIPRPTMRMGTFSQVSDTLIVQGTYAAGAARLKGPAMERGIDACLPLVENSVLPTMVLTFAAQCPEQ